MTDDLAARLIAIRAQCAATREAAGRALAQVADIEAEVIALEIGMLEEMLTAGPEDPVRGEET